jgi:hypothetical protein
VHHHHHHQHRQHRHGRLHFRRPFPNRQELLERLEAYQRDLEQEIADVEDLIRHLRDTSDAPAEPAEGQV